MHRWLMLALLAVMVAPLGSGREMSSSHVEIPRYIQLDEGWVCIDRKLTQVDRQDCWPRPRADGDERR
jgi:uncharacterized protein YchJ